MANALIFVADGFEEIEALTVVDILRRGEVTVRMVSVTDHTTVEGAHGIKILADMTFAEIEGLTKTDFDMLILPGGGKGTAALKRHAPLHALIKQHAHEKYIAAICAAPSVLGSNNLLDNKRAVCYPGFEGELAGAVVVDEKVVVDGNIITSKAAGTAMDFAFVLLKLLKGDAMAIKVKSEIFFLEDTVQASDD